MTSWSMSPGNFEYVFRSGVRLQVTPEGDCQEATFVGKGAGVGIRPLDAVTISVDGIPLFYGEVRIGGNTADINGHQYTLRSLALRLREVVIPANWSAPKQNAGLTVASLLNAVMPQLGGTFSVGTINLPFDCRPIKNANQQNPYALLEQIASDGGSMGGEYRFGVNAEKQFFFGPKNTGGMSVPADKLTAGTRYTAPVAEAPCTAVLWYVSKKLDGSWLTHMSLSPASGQYGVRVKPISLTSDAGLWHTVTDGVWEEGVRPAGNQPVQATALSGDAVAVLTDDQALSRRISMGAGFVSVMHTPQSPVTRYAVEATAYGEKSPLGVLAGPVDNLWRQEQAGWYARQANGWHYPEPHEAGKTFVVGNVGFGSSTGTQPEVVHLDVTTLRPERLDTDLLDRMANFYYSIPSESAAEIEAHGLYTGRGGTSPWGPVAAVEYRITAERGVCTAIMVGNPGDPNKLAQAELIKARDQRAIVAAVTSIT